MIKPGLHGGLLLQDESCNCYVHLNILFSSSASFSSFFLLYCSFFLVNAVPGSGFPSTLAEQLFIFQGMNLQKKKCDHNNPCFNNVTCFQHDHYLFLYVYWLNHTSLSTVCNAFSAFVLLTFSSQLKRNLISNGVLYLNIPKHIFATNIRWSINQIIVKCWLCSL